MARRTVTAAVVLAALLVGACGFTPLYARPGTVAGLSRVQVVVPQTRTGFLLRENLEDALAFDREAPPAYRLDVRVEERRLARGVRVDDTASRYEIVLDVGYSLTETATGQVVFQNRTPVQATYDAVDQPYAAVVAQTDGQARAAAQAAEIIKTDLAVFFSKR